MQLSSVQTYEVASPDYCFDFACRVRHPTGEFTYKASDIFFAPQVFRNFAEQLDAIREGKTEDAKFHDYGQMTEFSIHVHNRKTQVSLRIRVYQPGAAQTVLSAGFPVDYDLFVNALHEKVAQFVTELSAL
jgi:hypothetical protein